MASLSRREVEQGLPWVWTPDKLRRFAKLASTNIYVAEIDSRVVGFSIASLGDARAHLVLLAVDRRWRKSGIGRELLDWQLRAGLTAGLADMSLEVRANNKSAQQFYAAAGFRKLRVLPRYYSGLEDGIRFRLSPLRVSQPMQQKKSLQPDE